MISPVLLGALALLQASPPSSDPRVRDLVYAEGAVYAVDGGFLRGTDILKGIARGAAMVGIGRLQALALGAAGERGVTRMLEILETELTVTMKLLGLKALGELDGTYLQPATPVTVPGVFSALPLL